jgi:tetratricopeptide (TPR) repeat protein
MTKSTICTRILLVVILAGLQYYSAFAQLDTTSVNKLMNEGIIHLQNNRIKDAIQLFDQGREMLYKIAIAQDEKNQSIIRSNQLTREAERLIQQNNINGAHTLLNEAIELNPNNVEALKYRGSIRLIIEQEIPRPKDRNYIGLINDYTNAIRVIDIGINNAPRNSQEKKEYEREKAKILINRAYVKMQANRSAAFFSAIEDYTEAIRNDDENWDGYLGRAVAYNRIKDSRREVNDYLRSFELMQKYEYKISDAEWSELYLIVANAYSRLRDKRNTYDFASKSFNLGNMAAEPLMNKNKP